MKRYILIFVVCINVTYINAQLPGNVGSNFTSWFKADASDMSLTPGNNVISWDDVTNVGGLTMGAAQGNANRRPSLRNGDATSNWMPWVEFQTGSTQEGMRDSSTPDLLTSDGYIFMVNQTISNGSQVCFDDDQEYQMKSSRVGYRNGSNEFQIFYSDADAANPLAVDKTTQPLIITCMRGNNPYLRRNGNLWTTATNNDGAGVGNGLTFGFRGNPATEWSQMNLLEVITYDDFLTNGQIRRIESYLAIKYGTTLGLNGTSVNYRSSNGTTVWNATANPGYNYDIAGLARDNNSELLVERSHSINNTNPTASGNYNDIITGYNVIVSNGNFAIWGHNGNDLGETVNHFITTNGDRIKSVLNRKWKLRETALFSPMDAHTLEFDMRDVVYGNDLSCVKLLISDNTDFYTDVLSISPSSFDDVNKTISFTHDFPETVGSGKTFFFTLACSCQCKVGLLR